MLNKFKMADARVVRYYKYHGIIRVTPTNVITTFTPLKLMLSRNPWTKTVNKRMLADLRLIAG